MAPSVYGQLLQLERNYSMKTGVPLKYLWVYSAADEWKVAWHKRLLEQRLKRGFDVKHFCNTPLSLNRRWLPFPELDRLWKNGDRRLMELYEELTKQLEDRDVLVLYNGANLHPEFIILLPNIMKVYTFGDPESTPVLAQPIAPAFDIHLVNQFSEVDKFRGWGLKHVYFWPLGSLATEAEIADVNEENILDIKQRNIPVVLFAEYSPWRKNRLNILAKTFPDAFLAGRGWGQGFVDWSVMWESYRKAQIGWNIHNTTGFNFRTYELPAHGVMQICDNKSDLSKIFKVGKEVVGFETIDECIELTHYYLSHPREQREIALAGWKRWKQDYTPEKVWNRLVEIVDYHWAKVASNASFSQNNVTNVLSTLQKHKKNAIFHRILYHVTAYSRSIYHKAQDALGRVLKKYSSGDL
jgi:spore maturation protein CgeB